MLAMVLGALSFLFFLLHFKFPKIGGLGIALSNLIHLISLNIFKLQVDENILYFTAIASIYLGCTIYWLLGEFKKIQGKGSLSDKEVNILLSQGAKLIRYNMVFSLMIVSFQKESPLHLVKPGKENIPGIYYSVLSLLLGILGVPWGIIWTYQAIRKNLSGGEVAG